MKKLGIYCKSAILQKSSLSRLLICTFAVLLCACFPTTTQTPFPSTTPTATVTHTPTVVWFPPTNTPTAAPTIIPSATPELRPNVGGILYSDDFSLPTDWTQLETASDNIQVGGNEITLALGRAEGYIFSVLEGALFTNFYTEITASPNLCNGLDEYGLILRFQDPGNFYRFSLSCNGQARLDRVYGGIGSSPQPWIVTASVPRGAPSTSRLGVWAVGREMRFFINDQYQFTISDKAIPSGAMGVFVRANGETAVTVSFSDLEVYRIEQ